MPLTLTASMLKNTWAISTISNTSIARGRIDTTATDGRPTIQTVGTAYQILETLHSAPPASYSKFDTAIRVPSANDTRTGADDGNVNENDADYDSVSGEMTRMKMLMMQ